MNWEQLTKTTIVQAVVTLQSTLTMGKNATSVDGITTRSEHMRCTVQDVLDGDVFANCIANMPISSFLMFLILVVFTGITILGFCVLLVSRFFSDED